MSRDELEQQLALVNAEIEALKRSRAYQDAISDADDVCWPDEAPSAAYLSDEELDEIRARPERRAFERMSDLIAQRLKLEDELEDSR